MGHTNRGGSMNLNILIQTVASRTAHIQLCAGAGIVTDSKPRTELHGSRAKAKEMLATLGYG